MAAGSEQLFVSRLARLPVRAPSGETIGRIADVVIARRESGAPPPVLGFTVMVQRRPIFLGVGRVRELDESGAVLTTGSVNLRPFQQREGETLVIGELLDARVVHRETGKQLRLNAVAVGRVREEWVVTALDVLEPGGGLRPWRRAKHLRLPWEQVAGLEPAETAERRVAALANLRPFQQREGETLVIGELLDARVRHRETGKELRLNDVAIGRVREEWVVTALDVLEPGGGLRPWRRAKHLRVPWEQVAGLE
ncbi:MAG TPA: hypothetical protein VLA80_12740, partial [Actinomycetota bacterium]|nr:hypothetical protein [Actinomycetota bacterium]